MLSIYCTSLITYARPAVRLFTFVLSTCNQITWDSWYCHVWTRLPFLSPYLSPRGGSSPCRRCCASVRPTGCCWVRVPPEGASAQWFSPSTSQVDRSSAPTPPPSVRSGHSAHTPNTRQSPAAPPCVHSHPRAKGQGREGKKDTEITKSFRDTQSVERHKLGKKSRCRFLITN